MYGFTTTLSGTTFDEALAKTLKAPNAEGFGVLSDIDVQHAMTAGRPARWAAFLSSCRCRQVSRPASSCQ
jgi:hypothetical protein